MDCCMYRRNWKLLAILYYHLSQDAAILQAAVLLVILATVVN